MILFSKAMHSIQINYNAMFLTYFAAVFSTLLYISAGNSQPGPYPEYQCEPKYIVVPQQNPTSGSIFGNDPGVAKFTNVFSEEVYKCSILRKLFDLSDTTALEYSKFEYTYIQNILNYHGFGNADSLAEFSTRGIAKNFDVLTLPLMVKVKGNIIANILFVEGILTVDNAESLAVAYTQLLENNAKVAMTEDPTSKFQVLAQSFADYIRSVDDNAVTMAPTITSYFGNEWFVAALNYKWVNQ